MDRSAVIAWLRTPLTVVGTFFISGILAYMAADVLGLWDTPIAGCVAAFSVVFVSYVAAPSHRLWTAFFTFGVGAAAAWKLVGQSDFPESYGTLAYQPTHVPFLATIGGGIAALVLAFLLNRRRGTR